MATCRLERLIYQIGIDTLREKYRKKSKRVPRELEQIEKDLSNWEKRLTYHRVFLITRKARLTLYGSKEFKQMGKKQKLEKVEQTKKQVLKMALKKGVDNSIFNFLLHKLKYLPDLDDPLVTFKFEPLGKNMNEHCLRKYTPDYVTRIRRTLKQYALELDAEKTSGRYPVNPVWDELSDQKLQDLFESWNDPEKGGEWSELQTSFMDVACSILGEHLIIADSIRLNLTAVHEFHKSFPRTAELYQTLLFQIDVAQQCDDLKILIYFYNFLKDGDFYEPLADSIYHDYDKK